MPGKKDIDFLNEGQRIIGEELQAIQNLKNNLNNNFIDVVNIILNCRGRVVVTGIGKSGIVGQKISATFSSLGTPSFFMHPSEAAHGDLGMITKDDVLLAISNSGCSSELLFILPHVLKIGTKVIVITNNDNSKLAKMAHKTILLGIEKEACPLSLAPTSSTTTTMVLGDALASVLLKGKGFEEKDFALFHPGGQLGKKLILKVEDVMYRQPDVPFVNENQSLKKVILKITEKRKGVAIIINDNRELMGIITDGDLRRYFQKMDEISGVKAKDIMTKNVKVVKEKNLAVKALHLMKKYQIAALVVVNEKKLPIGTVHIYDLLDEGL